jgi:DNA repair photolyase
VEGSSRDRIRNSGRGAGLNPAGRFEPIEIEAEPEETAEDPSPETKFFEDASRSIITTNDSPDIPFSASLNPYRGCEHGCSYCYARPTHEYLGLSAGLDFESRIFAKRDAPQLLRRKLASKSWEPKTLAMSGVTDPYQPVERRLGITRGCLEVLAEARNPVAVVTKNHLVTRDVDLLADLARHDAASVAISLTTLDAELKRVLEPRTSSPRRRLAAVESLAEAGVPVGVMTAPIIPGINDHELPALLSAAADAGAQFAAYTVVRLPGAVAPLFTEWLERNLPDRKDKVLNRLRSMRGGRLNDPRFGSRMRGEEIFADQIGQLFEISRRRAGIPDGRAPLSTANFLRPAPPGAQSGLF